MKRTMRITYPYDKALVDRLDTCLKMCVMPHVIYNDKNRFVIYIDKGKCTWEQVKHEVNRVCAVKFRYVSDEHIEYINGKYVVRVDCGTIYA